MTDQTPKSGSASRPSIMSGIYRKVSLSLGRSKEAEKAKDGKTSQITASNDVGDAGDPNADGLTTPTESPATTPQKKPKLRTGSPQMTTSAKRVFDYPTVIDYDGTGTKPGGFRGKGHVRSISQQVDIDSLEWNSSNRSPTPSEDTDSDLSDDRPYPSKEGKVSKWTNYVTGWQDRWLVLKNGYLSYFRKKDEDSICRGTVELAIAFVQKHEFDSLRLDVQFVDQFYYLRAPSKAERDAWFDAIIQTQMFSEATGGIHKSGSMASLTSMTSVNSIGSGLSSAASIRTSAFTDKLQEVTTFKNIIHGLAEKLQSSMVSLEASVTEDDQVLDNTKQFRADLLMMKSTTGGMLAALEEAIEIAQRREDEWRKRLRRANEKRAKFEGLFRTAQATAKVNAAQSGPDMQEGPHSLLTEEAWFDALDSAAALTSPAPSDDVSKEAPASNSHGTDHDMGGVNEANQTIEKSKSKWEIVADQSFREASSLRDELLQSDKFEEVLKEEGMTVFRAAGELDGIPIDMNRTQAKFPGVTAKELCKYFADVDLKQEWEVTVNSVRLLESHPAANFDIYEMQYFRVWPSAARNAVFLTQVSKLGDQHWLAHTRSVDHEKVPIGGDIVRVQVKAVMFTKTVLREGLTGPPTRNDISTEVEYLAQVNPGGWAPASVVSTVARREFPKTLKTLGKKAAEHYMGKDIDNE